jgi:ABC-type branched-subunit amino acid transport system substrate-binding protein
MRRRVLCGGICGIAAAALALTACSSNSGSANPANNAATAAAGTQAGGSPATGTPINLVFLAPVSSVGTGGDGWPGVQAAIKYVNAHGGIKGRPLAAQECIDNFDSNLAAACATKAADDSSVIASVGATTLQGAAVDPILQQAGMPDIGVNAYVSADFNAPNLFALHIGGLAGLGVVAAAADLLHAKKISFLYGQTSAAATVIGLINSFVLTPRHLPPVNAVGVPNSAGDVSPAVAKAEQGSPGAIITYIGQAQANSFVRAARQQGVTTPILIAGTVETTSAVQQQLGGGQNLYFYDSFRRSGPFYDAFLSQWQAAGNSPSHADEFAINGWLSVTMLAQVARMLPTVTRSSVLAAFGQLTNYSTGGLLPPLTFSKPGTGLGGKAPRIVNPTMGLSQYQNGTFVPVAGGTFTNPFVVP